MKGNFHVRFLEGRGLPTARAYSVTAWILAIVSVEAVTSPVTSGDIRHKAPPGWRARSPAYARRRTQNYAESS